MSGRVAPFLDFHTFFVLISQKKTAGRAAELSLTLLVMPSNAL